MTPKSAELVSASALRAEFDRVFAEPRASVRQAPSSFLSIRVGSDGYAVPLGDVTSLYADHPIVAAPSSMPELLGIAGFRGAIVPVFDLRALLGSAGRAQPRWLMLVSVTDPAGLLGLAFDELEAHVRIAPEDVFEAAQVEGVPQARSVVRTARGDRPILSVHPLLHALSKRIAPRESTKER